MSEKERRHLRASHTTSAPQNTVRPDANVAWVESTPGHFEYGFRRRGGIICLPNFQKLGQSKVLGMKAELGHISGCSLFDDSFVALKRWHASSCRRHDHPRPTLASVPQFNPVEPEKSTFCEGRADGDYNIGCTSCYITCNGQRAFAMECPAGLVLDEASDMCVERSYVACEVRECGCRPRPTTTTTTEPASEETTPTPASEETTPTPASEETTPTPASEETTPATTTRYPGTFSAQ
ncbi:Chondroitin proteoglycan 1 [Toxocara canis]|uniref:Chondroitin proteoglycan 1 n=1 Tax=Toxocara canis TaxID=6265 RepID=A0A0B2VY79_TOXCA|nr:Chondroitin proteoglycan 1 [Toxocara canis]